MDWIEVNRFKTYRKLRWGRSDYLWRPENPYLDQYRIRVRDESPLPADILAIPCPHLPGKEHTEYRDDQARIHMGHRGDFDYRDMPVVCDSSMDYAFLDPVLRELLAYPQVRAFMTGVTFRDMEAQRRRSWGGEYHGEIYRRRDLYDTGPDPRADRSPLSPEIQAKLQPLNRPTTRPFSDDVFEYIQQRIKPLKERPIDLFFSGRTRYPGRHNFPTMQRTRLEELWPRLPGDNVWHSYHNYEGTRKHGKPIKSYSYPWEYVDMLLQAKVVVSPWGWSAWCIRDFEALACGCVVIKPECSNIKVYPDIYDPSQNFMVWCDILFEHLDGQLAYIYGHLDELQDRVDRGRKFVTDICYPNDKVYAHWTADVRRILEQSLNMPSYGSMHPV